MGNARLPPDVYAGIGPAPRASAGAGSKIGHDSSLYQWRRGLSPRYESEEPMTTSIPQARRTVTRKGVAFGLAAFVLSIGGCAPTAQLSQVPPTGVSASVAAPAISAGDSWTYQVRDGFTGLPRPEQRHEVIRVGGGRIEVAGNVERGDGRQVYDGEWNWLRRPATDLQTF